jgi:hypothetical protein
MPDLILRFLEWTLARCTKHPRGRHRAEPPRRPPAPPRPTAALPVPTPALPRFSEALDGTESGLVRPYLLGDAAAHLERRRQRERRRALYLATWGIDMGTHQIHGVQVATR